MRPFSENELFLYQNWIKDQIQNAQLQDVHGDSERVILELYRYELFWLVFDLSKKSPLMILCKSFPSVKKEKYPAWFVFGFARGGPVFDGIFDE